MKKILSILFILLVLCACNNKKDASISIVAPVGAPSLAFYNEINNKYFKTAEPKSILAELKGNSGSDIIVLDVANGIKLLNNGANYKMAAVITFGNFYIAASGNDDNGIMDDGDYIVIFSKQSTPDLIFHYLYGDSLDSNIHYVNSNSEAAACLIKGINISDEDKNINDEKYVDYVLIAEPALSTAIKQNKNITIYCDIQNKYKEKTNGLDMIQAAVFVSNDLDKKIAKEYLNNLKNDIETLLLDPNIFLSLCDKNSLDDTYIKDVFGLANKDIAYDVLKKNSIGLNFKYAIDIKEEIDNYINLFGMDKTNEEIYFK